MTDTRSLPDRYRYISSWDAAMHLKGIGAAFVLWSVILFAHTLGEGRFSLRLVPFHLGFWAVGGAVVLAAAQIEITSAELRFRTFRRWECVPLCAIEKVSYFRVGVCLVRISWQGTRKHLVFRPPWPSSPGQAPEVVQLLQRLVSSPEPLVSLSPTPSEAEIDVPVRGRPLSILKGIAGLGAAALIGMGQVGLFRRIALWEEIRGSDTDWVWWISTGPGLGIVVILLLRALARNWKRGLGTRDLEVKGKAIFTVGMFGYLVGAIGERWGVFPPKNLIPQRLPAVDVGVLAVCLCMLAIFLLVRMVRDVCTKAPNILERGHFGPVEILRVKELHRQLFPKSLLDPLVNVSVIVAAYCLGVWFLILASLL